MAFNSNKNNKLSLSKFESMLKTNNIYFFDSTEFETIIQHYLDVGRKSLAYKAIKLGLDQYPTSVNLKLLNAELLIYEDKLDDADKILIALHAIEPNNEEIYIQKAAIFSKQGEHKKAVESLKIVLAYSDGEADILAMIGIEYLYLDEFDNARLNFAKCLDVDIEDYSSLYNVIYCFDMQNQHAEAIKYLNDFIDKEPYSEVAWHQLGKQYFILKEYEEALKSFDYAVIIDDGFVGAYLERAKTLEQLQRHEEAIENYLISIELDDPTAFAYYRVGECYNKIDNKALALKFFKKTVQEDPILDKGWIALSKLCSDDKNYQKALYYINKAIAIDESNSLYWRMYAEINLKLDFFEEAVKAFYICLDCNDKDLEIFIGLADVLNFVGEFEDAISILIKGMRLYPNHTEIEYRLGCLYLILGDDNKGIKYLKDGLSSDFEYYTIFKELYPAVFGLDIVVKVIAEYVKPL